MEGLTKNEAVVIDFLTRNFSERNSINQLGRKLGLSPRGIYKILKNLEKRGAVKPEKIGNSTYYSMNLNDEAAVKLTEYVLAQGEQNSYARVQKENLEQLKDGVLACLLFGSVLKKGREAADIDVLLVLEKRDFAETCKKLEQLRALSPKIIHDIMMTRQDLINSIRKKDELVLGIIKLGKALWGAQIVVEAIKNGTA